MCSISVLYCRACNISAETLQRKKHGELYRACQIFLWNIEMRNYARLNRESLRIGSDYGSSCYNSVLISSARFLLQFYTRTIIILQKFFSKFQVYGFSIAEFFNESKFKDSHLSYLSIEENTYSLNETIKIKLNVNNTYNFHNQ